MSGKKLKIGAKKVTAKVRAQREFSNQVTTIEGANHRIFRGD
jgi:hypothetical protein